MSLSLVQLPAILVRKMLIAGIGALLLSRPGLAVSADAAPTLSIGSAELLNGGGGLIAVVIAIIVLGVIYARTQGLKSGPGDIITIIATHAIGPKERIAVVEVANKQLLIGMTATNVQTLYVFDEPVVVEAEQKNSFSQRLRMIAKNSQTGAVDNESSA